MVISTKMAVFIVDCSICQCTACMNLAMCMEYYVKCNFKIYLNLNDFTPLPLLWNVDEKWTGLQKQSKAFNLYIYLFFTQASIGIHTNLSAQQSRNCRHFIGNSQICAWLVYTSTVLSNCSLLCTTFMGMLSATVNLFASFSRAHPFLWEEFCRSLILPFHFQQLLPGIHFCNDPKL